MRKNRHSYFNTMQAVYFDRGYLACLVNSLFFCSFRISSDRGSDTRSVSHAVVICAGLSREFEIDSYRKIVFCSIFVLVDNMTFQSNLP